VLLADALPWEALDQLPAPEGLVGGPPPVWLALDEVQDPVKTCPRRQISSADVRVNQLGNRRQLRLMRAPLNF